MSTSNIEDTAPINTTPENPSLGNTTPVPVPARAPRPRRWLMILLGLLMVIAVIFLGGFVGYNNGKDARLAAYNQAKTLKLTTQFQLAEVDMQSGRFEMALKRIQFIIGEDPSFPGAADKLAQIMIAMSATATMPPLPTASATPASTSTPDTRGEEELFNAARASLASSEWATAIDTLDSLRKLNTTYRAIEVDGMYYVALRNRGMNKVRAGQLEEGMYDMSLTERFGPLDKEADTYRSWARLYVTGASFWEIDWEQVINYFSQLYAAVPMLSDSSGVTASERYRKALVSYGDKLAAAENYCEANQYYDLALQVSPDGGLGKKATQNENLCHPVTPTPKEATPIPTDENPIEPTVEPTAGPQPTVEPTTPVAPEPTVEPTVAVETPPAS